MKNRTKAIIILACALGATVPLAACSLDSVPDGVKGEVVKVYYHRNGGVFTGNVGVEVFDTIPVSAFDGKGVRLLEPGSPERQEGSSESTTASVSIIARANYSLVGWYRNYGEDVGLRVDAEGDALDDSGEKCKTSGKEQAYLYSGRWDYEGRETLTLDECEPVLDAHGNPTGSYEFHLYAGWAPVYSYTFYRETTEEEKRDAAARGESIGDWVEYATSSVSNTELAIPEWDLAEKGTGELKYTNEFKRATFPSGVHTLTGVYGDSEKKVVYADYTNDDTDEAVVKTVKHHGLTGSNLYQWMESSSIEVDGEKVTSLDATAAIYTTWKPGRWFKITSAYQLSRGYDERGCYILRNNLVFVNDAEKKEDNVTWSLGDVVYSGTFLGNGHTIEGIVSTQEETSQMLYGGVFGSVTASAVIRDVEFKGVQFNLKRGTNRQGGMYGLFAGTVSAQATIENVTVSGTMTIGGRNTSKLTPSLLDITGVTPGNYVSNYDVGKISADNTPCGISMENIEVKLVSVNINNDGVYLFIHALEELANGVVRIKVLPIDERYPDPDQTP